MFSRSCDLPAPRKSGLRLWDLALQELDRRGVVAMRCGGRNEAEVSDNFVFARFARQNLPIGKCNNVIIRHFNGSLIIETKTKKNCHL